MKIKITARHFKTSADLKEFSIQHIDNLIKFFDGIIKAEVVFSFEKNDNGQKTAEIILSVHNHILRTSAKSDDFKKSLLNATKKSEKQLLQIKSKFREKDRKALRKIKEDNN